MDTTHAITIQDQDGNEHMIVYKKQTSDNGRSSVTLELCTRFLPKFGFHDMLGEITVTRKTEAKALKRFKKLVLAAIKKLATNEKTQE